MELLKLISQTWNSKKHPSKSSSHGDKELSVEQGENARIIQRAQSFETKDGLDRSHTERLMGSPGKSMLDVINRSRGDQIESIFYSVDQEDFLPEYSSSLKGKKRRPNEDRYIVCNSLHGYLVSKSKNTSEDVSQTLHQTRLYAVIDGHGGSRCAEFITDKFIEQLVEDWQVSDTSENIIKDLCDTLEATLINLDSEFVEIARKETDCSGACVVAALYYDGWLCVSNVGDSEAVLLDHRGRTIKMSKRHSYDNKKEMSRIKGAGGSVVNGYIMNRIKPSRVMGDYDVKDLCEGVICHPDTYFVKLKKLPEGDGPILVLGSDGVWDVGKRKIVRYVNKHVKFWKKSKKSENFKTEYFQAGFVNPAQAVVDYARKCGSRDDITAVFTQF